MTELEIKATPEVLPLLPVRDMVMYPSVILPLFVGRDMSINAVEKSLSKDRLILVTAQKDLTDEDPLPGRIYSVGVVSQIMRMLRLPDGRVKVLMQGLKKAKIIQYVQETPTFLVRIQLIEEPIITEITLEIEALMRYVKEEMEKVVSMGRMVPPDILMVLDTIDEPGKLADVAAANLGLAVDKAQEILEIVDPIERLKKLSEILGKEIELLNMQAKILSQAKEEMSKSQREYFLREQMKAIRTELGEGDERSEDVEDLRKRIKKAKMPKDIEKETKKQLERLDMMHPDAVESTMLRTYIECLIELPWNKSTKDRLDIKKAKRILDEDHYDLDKVKERILEFLSVMKLKGEMKFSVSWVLPEPARPRWANPSRKLWTASSSASHSAGFMMRLKSAGTAGPISAPCPGASCRQWLKPKSSIPFSCWMKSINSTQIFRETPPRLCWRCSTPSKISASRTTIWKFPMTFRKSFSSPPPTPSRASPQPCSTAWKSSNFRATSKRKN